MDMPINIVPAPVGALVALYIGTDSLVVHRNCSVHMESDEDGGNNVYYTIRPVVAWGFYMERERMVNHPLVANEYGCLELAGLRDNGSVPDELQSMRDGHLGNLRLDAICTPDEVVARIEQIKLEQSDLEVSRWGNSLFTSESSIDVPYVSPSN